MVIKLSTFIELLLLALHNQDEVIRILDEAMPTPTKCEYLAIINDIDHHLTDGQGLLHSKAYGWRFTY